MAVLTGLLAGTPAAAALASKPGSAPTDKPAAKDTAVENAKDRAQRAGKRIEIPEMRTGTATYWANPDGKTLRMELSSGPVRVRRGNSWTEIDTALVQHDGAYTPKANVLQPQFSGGGKGDLIAIKGAVGDHRVGWASALPEPQVKDDTLTYRDAVPGGDLVVRATTTGWQQQIVLRERPKSRSEAPRVHIPFALPKGKTIKQTDRGFSMKVQGGITENTSPISIVDAAAAKSPEEGRRGIVPASVTQQGRSGQLTLEPESEFLSDPKTQYPVTMTVDAGTWIGAGLRYDTFTSQDYQVPPSSATWLHAGKYASGAKTSRAYVRFNIAGTGLIGSTINNADFRIWNYKSPACGNVPSGIQVRRITTKWGTSTLRFDNQPSAGTYGAHTSQAAVGTEACPAGEIYHSIEKIVQDWANGAPDYGLQLRAANESDATNWRMYHSSENSSGKGPKLIIDYTPAEKAVIVYGRVSRNGGYAPGVNVSGMARPASRSGDSLTFATRTTDASGAFALPVTPSEIPAEYKDADGKVQVDVVAQDGENVVNWTLTASQNAGEGSVWSTPEADAKSSSAPAYLQLDLGGTQPTMIHTDNDPADWESSERLTERLTADEAAAASRTAYLANGAPADAPPASGEALGALAASPHCNTWLTGQEKQAQAATALVSTANVSDATLTLKADAEQSLGVGLEVKVGDAVTLTADGKETRKVGITETLPYGPDNELNGAVVKTLVNYVQEKTHCLFGNLQEEHGIRWRPKNVGGINRGDHPLWMSVRDNDFATYCQERDTTSTVTSEKQNGATIGGGVTIDGLGSLSARSTWSDSLKLSYKFREPGLVCGTSRDGYETSPHIYTHPRPSTTRK